MILKLKRRLLITSKGKSTAKMFKDLCPSFPCIVEFEMTVSASRGSGQEIKVTNIENRKSAIFKSYQVEAAMRTAKVSEV
ncbi:hypothetical protein Acj9p113 [Acinetobacter phage Acj9]|uniref:Uncharacterized protein n=1 Tax=Acinetobacter phage Acj9 TaxID=760939 RepID=E5EPP7_9CAUD|nr:hypothetical protein Acj9p113 [Acinetobacter phage Acj9]ADG60013.1 hypothetical protein Acj9p113 [Acinetobacter phage Acj9]